MGTTEAFANFFFILLPEPWTEMSACLATATVLILTYLLWFLYSCCSKRSRVGAGPGSAASLNETVEAAGAAFTECSLKQQEVETHLEKTASHGSTALEESSEKTMGPTSVLRGFPEVDTLLLSPCQRFLFINCCSKRKARLYPQSTNRAFMARGMELQTKHFVSVDEAVVHSSGSEARVEICSAAFSFDGTRLAVAERNSDTFFVFIIGNKCQLTLESFCKLPDHRLVSSLPPWSLAGATYELIVMLHDKDCEVEVFSLHTRGFIGKEKFKVGNALAWARQDTTIAVAGSFLRETRVATLRVFPNGSGFRLHNSVHVQGGDTKLRVLALAVTSRNVPSFNTRTQLLVLTEDGFCNIYDMQTQTSGSKIEDVLLLVGQFKETLLAGWDPALPVKMAHSIYGTSYHERLSVALFRGGDIAVYRQVPAVAASEFSAGLFTLEPVVLLRDCHDGDPLKHVVFVQNGEGLATSGGVDGRHVRLWAIPPLFI